MYFVNSNHFICVYKIHLAYYSKLNIYLQVSYKEQFYMLRHPFWTFSVHHTSLRRQTDSSLLDFNTPSRRFNVQYAAARLPFWTSTRLPSTLTSNPPLHGYPITPARQKAPARMLFTSILAGANPYMYHKFYFPDVALSLAIALASAALE